MTTLNEALDEFAIAFRDNDGLTADQRRRVEAIVGWNVDKFHMIEEAYANKIRTAIREVLHQ